MTRAMLVLLAMVAACSVARAQGYPNRPLRIVVPAAPAGATDILSRILSFKLYESWGQVVQVDNRPGGGGIIASELVAKAAPDGYTLLMASTSHVTNPTLQGKLPYDTLNDFAPVSMVAVVPGVLLVHPSLPVHSVAELIAFAKRRPGELDYGSAGSGSATHLGGMLFSAMTGVILVHVPYKGGAPALNDLLGGRVSLMFGSVASSIAHIRSGRVRALAVTSARRSAALPHLPTMAEAGLQDYEATAWFALFAPAKTPGAVINKLNSEVVAALQSPDVKERLHAQGAEIVPGEPGQLGDYVRSEIAKWEKVIRKVGGVR
ncbi:MAG: tripartite tricarboxylate transporter substrate binding protein [Burkholderiales bacterium]